MKATNINEDWRNKYFDALSSMEHEQQRFRAMDAVLKRLAGRLCIASMGQSSLLDDELKKLQSALRREPAADELDQLTAALSQVINTLDGSAATSRAEPPAVRTDAAAGSAADEYLYAMLSTLLAELRRDSELVAQVDALEAKLVTPVSREHWSDALSSLTELIQQRIQRIERTKQEMEGLLSHMAERLDEISHYVADQNQSRNESQASSETLNTQLVGEIKAMGDSVESAVDLNQIRTQVRGRLDAIDQHLQAFRQREVALATAMRVRTELMQTRVQQLERERKKLHNQLKDEQRLSLIDALTKIPNRLAYEKRIEEELKRNARFNQPACLAVWDVDHFKRINDSYGHRAGDRVLQAVAEWLSHHIRGTDFLARYGGEEFVMLLCGTRPEEALRLMNEMRVAISNIRFKTRDISISITVSGGLTTLWSEDSAANAFERADKALYGAKEAGRNRCVAG